MSKRHKKSERLVSEHHWSYYEMQQLLKEHDEVGLSENELGDVHGLTKSEIGRLLQIARHRRETGDTDEARLERKQRETASDLIRVESRLGKEASTMYLCRHHAGLHDRIYRYFRGIGDARALRDRILKERRATKPVSRIHRIRKNAQGFEKTRNSAA